MDAFDAAGASAAAVSPAIVVAFGIAAGHLGGVEDLPLFGRTSGGCNPDLSIGRARDEGRRTRGGTSGAGPGAGEDGSAGSEPFIEMPDLS